MSYWTNLKPMGVSVIISREREKEQKREREREAVRQGLNQRNNTHTKRGPSKVTVSQMTLHQESHFESHPWIKCIFEQFPDVYGWARCILACTPLFPTMPAPPFSSSYLCNLRQKQHDLSHQYPLQHHRDYFDFSIDISYHPPACIFHAYPGMASMHIHIHQW